MRIRCLLVVVCLLVGCGGSDESSDVNIGDARLSWPSSFTYLEGPFAPVNSLFESQSLMIIVTKNNRIIYQVRFEPFAIDIGVDQASRLIQEFDWESSFVSFEDIVVKSIHAREVRSVDAQPDGIHMDALERWYYFPAEEISGEISKSYRLLCVTPVSNFEENQVTIRRVLDSVTWGF